jgi:alpha-beta hydrolase superfamily lysophospholipase
MSYFVGSRGLVFHQSWLPTGAVHGIVVFVHGYGEHSGLYETLAHRLTEDGIAVHALDAVGHGRSDGARAVIASWDHLVDDTRQLANLARAQHPGVPLVLAGHSGGGLAVFLLAQRSPQLAAALAVSAPPLQRLEWIDAELASGAAESEAGDPTEFLSTHPDYVHALLHDPLTWKGGFRRETLLAAEAAWADVDAGLAAGRPDVPVLLVHGDADPVVPVADSVAIAARLPRATVHVVPGDLHDVLNEHDRDAVHEVVAGFVASAIALTAADR